jgi:hypothetical protein
MESEAPANTGDKCRGTRSRAKRRHRQSRTRAATPASDRAGLRRSRIEYPGALHHVINQGNYRRDLFATEGADPTGSA